MATTFDKCAIKKFSKCANGDEFRLSPRPFFSLDNSMSSVDLFFLNKKFRQSRKWGRLSISVPLKNSRIAQMETNFHYLLGPSSPLTIQRLQLIYFSLIKNFANRANGDDFRGVCHKKILELRKWRRSSTISSALLLP